MVVICSPGSMVTDRLVRAVLGERWRSVTDTLNENAPDAVGVPDRTPALLRFRPGGKVPDATFHVYGSSPPLAVRTAL